MRFRVPAAGRRKRKLGLTNHGDLLFLAPEPRKVQTVFSWDCCCPASFRLQQLPLGDVADTAKIEFAARENGDFVYLDERILPRDEEVG